MENLPDSIVNNDLKLRLADLKKEYHRFNFSMLLSITIISVSTFFINNKFIVNSFLFVVDPIFIAGWIIAQRYMHKVMIRIHSLVQKESNN